MRRRVKILLLISAATFTLCLMIVGWAFSKEETRRFSSPDGDYQCVVTRFRYQALTPAFPGQGSDYSCFLTIYNGDNSLGTIAIPLAWMVNDLKWTEDGAKLTAAGEWDFKEETCYYWNSDQTAQTSGL